jgi:hypothetical protein
MDRVRRAFDPEGRMNPCKILPGGSSCREAHAAPARAPAPATPRPGAEAPWI